MPLEFDRLLAELKRRRVFRSTAAYVVIAFALLQGADIVLPALRLPPWTMTFVVVLALLGFPLTVVLAWVFDVTRGGVVRTANPAEPAVSASATLPPLAARGLGVVVVLLIAGGGWLAWHRRAVAEPLDARLVAVLPFRVAGAEPSLGYLREGMLDLLAAKLTGEAGPRAVDARTLTSAWRRAVGDVAIDLSRDEALALARALGAGRLVLGEVVSMPGRVVLTASLSSVASGRTDEPVSSEGPLDSLPAIVDRLVAGLLSVGAGEGERLASLTTTSLPALRLYLEGQADYRGGRYDEAFTRFSRAAELDSTFALASFMVHRASGWIPNPAISAAGQQALARAWRHRERLGERDRVFLTVLAGRNYPGHTPGVERLAAREAFVREQPDNPEAWFAWADELMHHGAFLDIPDSAALRRASEGFGRTLALDSMYLPALGHLFDIAHLRGDTAAMRQFGSAYIARDPTGLTAETTRNLLAARSRGAAALPEIIARMDAGGAALRAYTIGFLSWVPETYPLAMALRQGWQPGFGAGNHGRPAEALHSLDERRRGGQLGETAYHVSVLRDALHWDGDTITAASSARQLEATRQADRARIGWDALCVEGQWLLARRHPTAAAPVIDRLRAIGLRTAPAPAATAGAAAVPGEPVSAAEEAALRCAELLATWQAVRVGAADAGARIARLDSLLATGALGGRLTIEANLVLARLLEDRGDRAGASRVLGRYPAFFIGEPGVYLSTLLRERGRVATLLGDTAAAVAAYRHFLVMRTDPEPPLQPEVERIRAELARLTGERNR